VARPSDDISHTFHHLPAIHANVPDPTGVTQIPNSTREQCMTRDSLNRDDEPFSLSMSRACSKTLA
jgi:hypothetical protein